MSWTTGAGFRIVGHVVRKFVVASGKCAFLTLAVQGDKGERKHDLRAFDDAMIEEVGALGVGQTVQATGVIDVEALKDKAKKDVTVDGRICWVEKLTIKKIDVEGASRAPAAPKPAPAPGAPLPGDNVDW